MAVAALVLGALGLIPLLGAIIGLTGIVLAVVVLAARRPGRGLAIGGLVAGIVCTFVAQTAFLMLSLKYAQRMAMESRCSLQMRAIGSGLSMYAMDWYDYYPDNLARVDDYTGAGRELLVCPASGRHAGCDYIYCEPERHAFSQTIVLCDKEPFHPSGRNVLRVDGHVGRLTEQQFNRELQLPHNLKFAQAFRSSGGR